MVKSGDLFVKIGSPLHISHFLFVLSKFLTPAYLILPNVPIPELPLIRTPRLFGTQEDVWKV